MKKSKKVKKLASGKKRVVKKKPAVKKDMNKDELLASLTYGGGGLSDRDRYEMINILDAIKEVEREENISLTN